MSISSLIAPTLLVCAILCAPVRLLAQTVTLNGSPSVASAEDYATRSFQDPWDMNERTDFGWFLYGNDAPGPQLSNISFSGSLFHATTGTSPSLFLVETGNPFAARVGKIGTTYPINADFYKLIAIKMYINGNTQARLGWNRDHLWDGPTTLSNTFDFSPGWRTYFISIPATGIYSGPAAWSGMIRSLQFFPSYPYAFDLYIDWIRLVNIDPALCRQVTWSGLTGPIELYLSHENAGTNPSTLLAAAQEVSTGSSDGCANAGSGYTFYAGGLAAGSYRVIAKRLSDGALFPSSTAYVVNAAPTLILTAPSEEGSADDFATTQLGNPWDMDALSDIDRLDQVTGAQIATIQAETPAGAPLPNTRVFWGTSVVPPPGLVGDPQLALLWEGGNNAGARIDPSRYRILTAEFGMPNTARNLNNINGGSIARIVWRVAGSTLECVSDDIIFNSRVGANVLDKFSVDMADRNVLPLEQGAGLSQQGWVGGIDRFRFDPHEFSNSSPFFVRRVKLAALDRVSSGSPYTFRWTASEGNGTVTLYYDTDRNPSSGRTLIGSAATSAGAFTWTVPNIATGEYYIYAEVNDGQNVNSTYSRFPMVLGGAQPPSAPPNPRIIL